MSYELSADCLTYRVKPQRPVLRWKTPPAENGLGWTLADWLVVIMDLGLPYAP